MTSTKGFNLRTAAIEQDALHHPKVTGEAQRLLRDLDRVHADIARASCKDRIAQMLSEAGGIDALVSRLRFAVEDAEQLRSAIMKTGARLSREDRKLRDAVDGVCAELSGRRESLRVRGEALNHQIRETEHRRLEAMKTLTKAGMTPEEAEARAKPSQAELRALRDELAAIPLRMDSINNQLASRRMQVHLLEGRAKEIVA